MAYSVEKTLSVVWLDEKLPYYSATGGIRTSDLPHSMTMSKKVLRSYPQGHGRWT